ncbi:bacteriocin [Kordia sp.]
MLEKFKKLNKEQMNAINGGAQEVADIDRVQPN